MILGDKEYKQHITKLVQLDWTGFDVVLFGGIVSGWETRDIDLLIWGHDEKKAIKNMTSLMRAGQFDVYFTKQSYMMDWHPDKERVDFNCVKLDYRGNPTWNSWHVPFDKQAIRMQQGIQYGENIKIIQNGEQIYF